MKNETVITHRKGQAVPAFLAESFLAEKNLQEISVENSICILHTYCESIKGYSPSIDPEFPS